MHSLLSLFCLAAAACAKPIAKSPTVSYYAPAVAYYPSPVSYYPSSVPYYAPLGSYPPHGPSDKLENVAYYAPTGSYAPKRVSVKPERAADSALAYSKVEEVPEVVTEVEEGYPEDNDDSHGEDNR